MFYCLSHPEVLTLRFGLKPVKPIFSAVFPKKKISFDRNVFYGIQEIAVSPALPKCKVYLLPEVSPEMYSDLKVRKGGEDKKIPEMIFFEDILMVSEKVKNIIEDLDNIQHQFVPMSFLKQDGKPIDQGPFYFLHIRRVLEIEPSENRSGLWPQEATFNNYSSPSLVTITEHDELKTFTEQLPIWVHDLDGRNVYLSKEVIDRFKKENIAGVKEYTSDFKNRDANLGRFNG